MEALSIEENVDNEYVVRLFLYQEKFQDSLTDAEVEMCINMSTMEQDRLDLVAPCDVLYTPSGNQIVLARRQACSSSQEHINRHIVRDANILVAHPNVELIRMGSCKYNCHSYAWYSQDEDNGYWIDNPAPYMSLNSGYIQALSSGYNTSLNILPEYIVFYGTVSNNVVSNNSHSAIIDDEPSNIILRNRTVVSKW